MKLSCGQPGQLAIISVVLCLFAGCDSPRLATVGRVSFVDGSPVQAGRIEFRSLDDGQRYVSPIDPDGIFFPFDSNDRKGLPVGEYEVVVVQMVITEDLAAEAHDHGNTVPRRYADYYTSDLKTKIDADHQGEIRVVLELE